MLKGNIDFQNVLRNATKKREIATLLTFLTKQRKFFAKIFAEIGNFWHQHCLHVCTFLNL